MSKREISKRARNIKRIRKEKERNAFMKFGAKIRAYLFTGILVTAPVAITFYMAYNIIIWVDEFVNSLIPPRIKDGDYMPITIPGLGVIVLTVALVFVGMVATGFIGRFFIRLGEWIVNKMPIISSVYSLLKQVFETFLSQKKNAFNKVVMLEYPRRGIWILGLVSGPTNGEVKKKLKQKMTNVFIPTTPNPTSGFLIFVPNEDIIELNMSVEEGLKFIISCGIVNPEEMPRKKK